MADSIPQRNLRVTIAAGTQTVTLTGYRMSAVLQHAGGASTGQMFLTIWGLSFSLMNQLSTFGVRLNIVTKNSITLEAGDNQLGMATVFVGTILQAAADFNAQPEVGFHITAHCVLQQAVAPASASSFRGSIGVAIMMSGFATQMGLKFENSGVDAVLRNATFSGSAYAQMRDCAEAAGINATIINGTLAIWPKFGSRNGSIPIVSPSTGMIGYPTFTALGVSVRSLFNPSIGFGQQIKVQSSLQAACGTFTVYDLQHELDVEMLDGGKWHSKIEGYNPKAPMPASFS